MTLTQLTNQHSALLAAEREHEANGDHDAATQIRAERDRIADTISDRYKSMF